MITRNDNANLGVCAGKQGGHSLPVAQPHQTSIPFDVLPRIAFAQLPDHAPEAVSLSALDHLEWR